MVLVAGAGAALGASVLPGVASLGGSLGARERDGAIVAVVLLALATGAAALPRGGPARGAMPARTCSAVAALLAVAIVALAAIGLVVGGLNERRGAQDPGGARLG